MPQPRRVPALTPLGKEVAALLERRCIEVEGQLSAYQTALDASLKQRSHPIERINLIEGEYLTALLRAERDWLTGIVDDIREGRLTWQPVAA
jgi:hypothetical protein